MKEENEVRRTEAKELRPRAERGKKSAKRSEKVALALSEEETKGAPERLGKRKQSVITWVTERRSVARAE